MLIAGLLIILAFNLPFAAFSFKPAFCCVQLLDSVFLPLPSVLLLLVLAIVLLYLANSILLILAFRECSASFSFNN